jgi:hypothetical protein
VQLHLPGAGAGFSSWTIVTLASFLTFRRVGPLVAVPRWTKSDTLALVLVLLAVPGLVWLPFTRIGALDEEGNRRYRAYFTADFLWHVALTAELARMDSPPRNPYLVSRPLNYYWSYFVVPAFISQTGLLPLTHNYLTINALCAGLVFVSMIFIFAWLTIPRAGPVAAGTLLALVAASAEGVHAMWTLWQGNRPFEELRHLNIDAITYWFLRGLTVDGLPRSLWYTPQHAAACALSLIALAVPVYAPAGRPVIGLVSGVALGCALIVSPAIGGALLLDLRVYRNLLRTAPATALVRLADDHGPRGSADRDSPRVVRLQRHLRGRRRSGGVRALTVRDGGASHDPDAGAGSAARDRHPGADSRMAAAD